MPATPKTSRMRPAHHTPAPGSGQIAQPRQPTKFRPYRPVPHLRAAEIDALPVAVGMSGIGIGEGVMGQNIRRSQ